MHHLLSHEQGCHGVRKKNIIVIFVSIRVSIRALDNEWTSYLPYSYHRK